MHYYICLKFSFFILFTSILLYCKKSSSRFSVLHVMIEKNNNTNDFNCLCNSGYCLCLLHYSSYLSCEFLRVTYNIWESTHLEYNSPSMLMKTRIVETDWIKLFLISVIYAIWRLLYHSILFGRNIGSLVVWH